MSKQQNHQKQAPMPDGARKTEGQNNDDNKDGSHQGGERETNGENNEACE